MLFRGFFTNFLVKILWWYKVQKSPASASTNKKIILATVTALIFASSFFLCCFLPWLYKWMKRKTNTLMVVWALDPNEEMARRETIFRLANESADQCAPIWRVYVGCQSEKLRTEHQNIGSSKIQSPLLYHYSVGVNWKNKNQLFHLPFLDFHFALILKI